MLSVTVILALFVGIAMSATDSCPTITSIQTSSDFIDFIKSTQCNTYAGLTVTLENSVSLYGYDGDMIENFEGTFDGKWHTISDLHIKSGGLFVSSKTGMTISNLAFDKSCTIETVGEAGMYAGFAIGRCIAAKRDCVVSKVSIAGSVNVGSTEIAYVGSVIGTCVTSKYGCVIRNIDNYGSVTSSAISGAIGGIMGVANGNTVIYKAANYGSVTAASASTFGGGIVGSAKDVTLDYVLSYGKVANTNTSKNTQFVGRGIAVEYKDLNFWTSRAAGGNNDIDYENDTNAVEIDSNFKFIDYFGDENYTSVDDVIIATKSASEKMDWCMACYNMTGNLRVPGFIKKKPCIPNFATVCPALSNSAVKAEWYVNGKVYVPSGSFEAPQMGFSAKDVPIERDEVEESGDDTISTGAIVGIIVGCVVVVIVMAVILFLLNRRG